MSALKVETMLYAGAALGVVGLAYFLYKQGPGLITGNNAITRSATNAAGEPVTAYQGAGVIGTIGAATNAASGGFLASLGEWLGGKAADLHDYVTGVDATAATGLKGSSPAVQTSSDGIYDRWDYYAKGGQSAASGSGSPDWGGASGGW